jgi:hypothetical protein
VQLASYRHSSFTSVDSLLELFCLTPQTFLKLEWDKTTLLHLDENKLFYLKNWSLAVLKIQVRRVWSCAQECHFDAENGQTFL